MEAILTEPKWTDIEQGCNYISKRITELNLGIKYIVGITRGGLVPAVVMSYILNIPTVTVSYSSSGKGHNKYYNNIMHYIEYSIVFLLYLE